MIQLIELLAARREEFESLVVSRVPIEVLKAHSQQTLELIQEKKRIGFFDAEKAELIELWNKELCSCGKAYGDHTQDEMRAGFDRDKINGIEDQGIIPDSAGNGTSGQTPERIAARRHLNTLTWPEFQEIVAIIERLRVQSHRFQRASLRPRDSARRTKEKASLRLMLRSFGLDASKRSPHFGHSISSQLTRLRPAGVI